MEEQRIFDDLDAIFSQQCADLRGKLEEILAGMPSGRIPDEQEELGVYKSLHLLRKTRDQYYDEARKILGDEDMPGPDTPLSTLRDALSQHWSAEHKGKLIAVLEQFGRVTSRQERYSNLLSPLQDSTRQLIALLEKGDTRPEEASKAVVGPRLFLRALEMDPHSAEGAAFIEEELSAHYSGDVRIGFFVGAYIAPEHNSSLQEPQSGAVEAPTSATEKAAPVDQPLAEASGSLASPQIDTLAGAAGQAESSSSSALPGQSASVAEQDTAAVPAVPESSQSPSEAAEPVVATMPEETAAAAAPVKVLRPAPKAPTAADQLAKFLNREPGEKIKAVNRPKTGASASNFKKGLLEIARTFHNLPSLLNLMGTIGAASAESICGLGHCAGAFSDVLDADVRRTLDLMARKGWAAEFRYEEDGQEKVVYGLSEFCAGSLRKDSIASLLRRIGGQMIRYAIGYGPSEDRSCIIRSAQDADALLYLLDSSKDDFRAMAFSREAPLVSWKTVSDWFQFCRISVDDGTDHPIAYCQLVHSGSDPDLVALDNLLYVQRPGENPPDDRWKKVSRDLFITYFNGDYTIEAGEWEEPAEDSLGTAVEAEEDPQLETSQLQASAAPRDSSLPPSSVSQAAPASAPEETKVSVDSSEAEAEEAAVPLAASEAPEQPRLPAAKQHASVMSRPLTTTWKRPTPVTKQSVQAVLHDPVGRRRNASRGLVPAAASEQPSAEEKEPRALTAVLDAAASGPTPDDSLLASAALEIIRSAVSGSQKNAAFPESAAQAVLMAKSGAMVDGYEECQLLSHQIQLATGMHIDDLSYSSSSLEAAFPDPESADPALLYAAYTLALLMPGTPGDYLLRTRARDLFSRYEEIFPKLPEFKGLFRSLLDLWEKSTGGFSASVMALLGSNSDSESYVEQLAKTAKDLMHVVTPTTQLKPLVPTHNAAFGPRSDLHSCMSIISRDVRHKRSHVERILAGFCDPANPDAFILDEERIQNDLTKKWNMATSGKCGALEYGGREKEIRSYKQRLELMVAWVRHIRTLENWPKEMGVLKKMRDKLLRDIDQIERKASWQHQPSAVIMRQMLATMRNHLENHKEGTPFTSVLKTGRFWLDAEGLPEFNKQLSKVAFFEPWRHAALHFKALSDAPQRTYEDACAEILDEAQTDQDSLMDNLYQLESMRRLLGDDAPFFEISDDLREATREAAVESRRELEQALDIAYALGQVNLDGKKEILDTLQEFEPLFFEKGDFAMWRWFLGALLEQISASADRRLGSCAARIEEIRAAGDESPLLDLAEKELKEYRNFTIAEEYLNHHESGDYEWRPTDGASSGSSMFFDDFRKPEVFQPLLEECRRNGEGRGTTPLKSFGTQYVQDHRPEGWTMRHTGDSAAFLQAWPGGKGTPPEMVSSFLTSLGLDVTETVLKRQKGNVEVFEAKIKPVPSGKKDYTHPIAAFGTRMDPTLRVVTIYGKCMEEQLIETMRELDYDDISLVLLDYHMDLGQRRRLAEIFYRQTQGQNRYLVVDRVLALYLALRTRSERLKAMLQCTLPYTACQPFGGDGGATPDEMFCGREKELASIMSPGGASIVYGGRQLGKTALLQRAQNRFHSPAKHRYAAYANIQTCDTEEKLVRKLVQSIRSEVGDAVDLEDTSSLEQLCTQLAEAFREKRISSLLLLMDEADVFLKSIDKDLYAPLQPLVELRQTTRNQFKFVLAGLHNVCRAERAMAENGIFGQLGTPLCIRPLTSAEASRLLRRPLRYLGFDIPDRQLETLITNSNFYPGVLQFIGYMLVETVPEHYRKAYYSAVNNPPFGLDDNLLGTVLKSRDLNASIQSKVRATLELDERYFMIARAIALLSYLDEDAQTKGYTVQAIRETASDYDVRCLADETASSLATLLDEMVDMGLLISSDSGRYRFRRDSFKDIVGTDADMLEEALRGKAAPV